MTSVRQVLLRVPSSDPRQRPLVSSDPSVNFLDDGTLSPYAFLVQVLPDAQSEAVAHSAGGGGQAAAAPSVVVVSWFDPAKPCQVVCTASKERNTVIVTAVDAGDDPDVVLRSLVSLIQRAHAEVQMDDIQSAMDEVARTISRDTSRVVAARHHAFIEASHRALGGVPGADPARQTSVMADWRGKLAVVRGLLMGTLDERSMSRTIDVFASEVSETVNGLQTAALMRLVALQEEAAIEREVSDGRRAEAQGRLERLVSRFGLAALLPGMWLAYWGSEVAPQIANPTGTIVVLVGIMGFALLGDAVARLAWISYSEEMDR